MSRNSPEFVLISDVIANCKVAATCQFSLYPKNALAAVLGGGDAALSGFYG